MAEKGPLFGGAPGEDVNEWIAVVNIQFLSLKLAEDKDDERYLKAIGWLRGAAALWFENYKGAPTWKAFAPALARAMNPQGQVLAREDLFSLDQGAMSLEAYTAAATKVFAKMIPALTEREKLHTYLRGLRSPYREERGSVAVGIWGCLLHREGEMEKWNKEVK